MKISNAESEAYERRCAEIEAAAIPKVEAAVRAYLSVQKKEGDDSIMSLLKTAEKQNAYLKAGILGFAGTGKTFTATDIAIGLATLPTATKKTIAFFDTETGSDYVIGTCKARGVELAVAKTRAFKDLLEVVNESEKAADVLIIDSISHVWTELLESYMRKKNKNRLSIWDWNPIKTEWRQFTDAYLCSKVHIILCGRAAFTYDEYLNDEGEKEIIKTGTKMRVESDMGYEPSLLLEMERIQTETDPKKKRGSKWIHRCTVLKDRTDLMNGTTIDNPRFKDFLPIVNALNLGGEHFVIDPSRNSDSMIHNPDYSYEDRRKSQTIYCEEIEGELISSFPGQSTAEKKIKTDILDVVFDSRSWAKIKEFPPDKLVSGLKSVKYLCGKLKACPPENDVDVVSYLRGQLILMDDDIPEFQTQELPLS